MIYFIREGFEGNIKIGYTTDDIYIRKQSLQTGNSKRLIIIGTMDGDLDFEARLKEQFKHCRLVGEWFSPTIELLEYIKDCIQFHEDYLFYLRELRELENPQMSLFRSYPDINQKFGMPTEYYSELAKVYLPTLDMQILMVIIKHTWGNNPPQREAMLTTKDFINETGSRQESHIKKAIKRLLKKRMIIEIPPTYSIQKNYKEWILKSS